MFGYIRETIRTHPFNFLTMLVSLGAAAFAGLSVHEAYLTRIGADEALRIQAKNIERSRKAADKSAQAAEENASAAKLSAQAAETTVTIAQRASEDVRAINRLELDPQIDVELNSVQKVLTILNVSNVDAIHLHIKIYTITLGNTQPHKSTSRVYGFTTASDCEWSVPEFVAHSSRQFNVTPDCIPRWLPELDKYPEIKPFVLVELSYLRNPDRFAYRGHAAYFVEKDGLKSPGELPDSELKRNALARLHELMHQGSLPYDFGERVEIDWSGYK
jgi:hypothetical protein